MTDEAAAEILKQTAQDYEEIGGDLETGAVEIRHLDLMRQRQ